MKETFQESAYLKQLLKHEVITPTLLQEVERHPQEASEAVWEVENGYDTCAMGSYVEHELENPTDIATVIESLLTMAQDLKCTSQI